MVCYNDGRGYSRPSPWFTTTTGNAYHADDHGFTNKLPTEHFQAIRGDKKKAELNMRLFNSAFCDALFKLSLWSWRDSNSRPNEELICFLHVYLRFDCREQARPKPPT